MSAEECCSALPDRARLSAVDRVPAGADANVGEIALGFENPLVAVVDGTVVLGNHFQNFSFG